MQPLIFRFKKYGVVILAILVMVSLNYNPQMLFHTHYKHWGWNFSVLTSLIILLLFRFRDPENWKQKLGIKFNYLDGLNFAVTFSILLFLSFYLVNFLTPRSGFVFKPLILNYKEYISPNLKLLPILGDYFYYVPETFNEEIFIGAFLLMGLERKFRKLNLNIIVVIVALFFSLMHQAMYTWSPVQSGIVLTNLTIVTLFFVGVLRNALILKTRKIIYSWAIHMAFNFIFFPGLFINISSGKFASEPERFNIVFGNITMVCISGILALTAVFWLNQKRLFARPESVAYMAKN